MPSLRCLADALASGSEVLRKSCVRISVLVSPVHSDECTPCIGTVVYCARIFLLPRTLCTCSAVYHCAHISILPRKFCICPVSCCAHRSLHPDNPCLRSVVDDAHIFRLPHTLCTGNDTCCAHRSPLPRTPCIGPVACCAAKSMFPRTVHALCRLLCSQVTLAKSLGLAVSPWERKAPFS